MRRALEALLWVREGQLFQEIAVPNPPPLNWRIAVAKPLRFIGIDEPWAHDRGWVEITFTLKDYPRRGGERCHYLLDPMSVPKGWRVDYANGRWIAEELPPRARR